MIRGDDTNLVQPKVALCPNDEERRELNIFFTLVFDEEVLANVKWHVFLTFTCTCRIISLHINLCS